MIAPILPFPDQPVRLGDRVCILAEGLGIWGKTGFVTYIEADDDTLHVAVGGFASRRSVVTTWRLRRSEVERLP